MESDFIIRQLRSESTFGMQILIRNKLVTLLDVLYSAQSFECSRGHGYYRGHLNAQGGMVREHLNAQGGRYIGVP